jgi:hypothetical protein
VLPALLHEVQFLRSAIEQATLVRSRMQLSLLLLDSEQERVTALAAVLRDVHDQLEADALQRLQTAEARSLDLNDRLDRIEDILSQPPRRF